MYSETIRPLLNNMFDNLQFEANKIIHSHGSGEEAAAKIVSYVGAETQARSKEMLDNMYYDLSASLLNTVYLTDKAKQNRFHGLNLHSDIAAKYKFKAKHKVKYKEENIKLKALKFAGVAAAAVFACETGILFFMSKLHIRELFSPLPIGILIIVSLGAAMIDYFVIEPNINNKRFNEAVGKYLFETRKQLTSWFDEIERYFNKRISELEKTYLR